MRNSLSNLLKNQLFRGKSIRTGNMATTNQLEDLLEIAEREGWPFPRRLEVLRQAGVGSYNVQVGTYHIVYFGEKFGEWVVPVPKAFKPLSIAEHFSSSGLEGCHKTQGT